MISRNEILIGRIEQELSVARVGVIVRGIVDIKPVEICNHIAEKIGGIKLGVVGYEDDTEPNDKIELADNIEKVVEWRSHPDNAGRILVFVNDDVPKMHSLKELNAISTRDFSLWLLKHAQSKMSFNDQLSRFWGVLISEVAAFPYSMVEDFTGSVLASSNEHDVIPRNMWRLGLLRDDKIFDNNKSMGERVKLNRDLLVKMGQLAEENRRRMNSSIAHAKGSDKDRLINAFRHLQEIYRRGGIEPLKALDFETVNELFSSSKKTKPSKSGVAVAGGSSGSGTDEEEKQLKGRELQQEIDYSFLKNDEESQKLLSTLADHIKGSLDNVQDNSIPQLSNDDFFDGRKIVFDKPENEIRKFIGYGCSKNAWGGIYTTDSLLLKDAIKTSNRDNFDILNPYDPSKGIVSKSFFEIFKSCDQYVKEGNRKFSEIIKDIEDSREILLNYLDMIVLYPFVLLGGIPEAKNALIKYIDAYTELYRNFNESRVKNEDSITYRYIAGEILKLEVIYIKTPKEWKGMITPLHPFHLWRFYEILKTTESDNFEVDDTELKQMSMALTQMPHLLHYLVRASDDGDGENVILPQAGYMGSLPTFENKTNRFLGNDGVDFIRELLDRWIAYAPYARNEIRIALIDVPDIYIAFKTVIQFLKESSIARRVVIDAYFTRGQNVTGDFSRFDYDDQDHELNERIKNGSVVINWHKFSKLTEVTNSIIKRPVHISYFFDQSQYKIGYGRSFKQLYVSPLVISYDYEYSEQFHRGTMSPSSKTDSGLFGDYHDIINSAAPMPAGQTLRMTFNSGVDLKPIDNLVKNEGTIWLSIADRVLTPYSPDGVIPLGEIRSGQRDIGVWASEESKVISQFSNLLRRYNLNVNEAMVSKVVNDFGHIASGGIITLPRYGGSVEDLEKKRKGLLGTVITAAWYSNRYPNALIASLDTKLARLWLSGRTDNSERADLIGLRMENERLIIEPIEVKSHKEVDDISEKVDSSTGLTRIEGKPVSQIEAMQNILNQIFDYSAGKSVLTASRREVLKYQLHTECFRERHTPEWQKDWYNLLKNVFSENPDIMPTIHIGGIVVHVLFEENGDAQVKSYEAQNITSIQIRARAIQGIIGTYENVIDTTTEDPTVNLPERPFDPDTPGSPGEPKSGEETKYEESTEVSELPEVAETTEVEESIVVKTTKSIINTNSETPVVENQATISMSEIIEIARSFKKACSAYRIQVDECDPARATIGPSVLRFYVKLSRGQSLEPLKNSLEDIGREMCRSNLMINKIHNSNEIALDMPRSTRDVVSLQPVLDLLPVVTSPEQLFFPIGRTPEGDDVIKNLGEMPHLLIGGSTGSGKTILLYSILLSLIKTHPDPKDMKLFISSSGLEDFIYFEGLPHLVGGRVISNASEAVNMIKSLINDEFERRKTILTQARCPNIIEYNKKNLEKLPPLVVIVDEFADLTDSLSKSEKSSFYDVIRQIAQIGRKRGVHLVLCTQRPSATLVPTDIRSQINARIGLRVNDTTSSKMILDMSGAQNLQNRGDLLFKEGESTIRAQGYYIAIDELERFLSHYLEEE